MRPCIRILLFQRFLLLNMFRATRRSSSGAEKPYLKPLVLHTYVKPETANRVFELLMISDVSLETC